MLRWLAALLTVLALASLVLLARGIWPPVVIVLVAGGLLRHWHGTQIEAVLHSAGGFARDLSVLSGALARLERERFTSPRLAALHARIESPDAPASADIRRFERLVEAHDWEHNLVFTPIAVLLLWSTHIAWMLEDWRRVHGPQVRGWLDTVGEFEALSSLATYHFEHPADPFPQLLPGGHASIAADGLGHPLLPVARAVRNDVSLGGATRVLVVSGSNMSGKSTMLRTVGINAVLAFAGAPVRAHRLVLSPFALGATLRIQDSLLEGRSRFYAEITRVRTIVDAARESPLLFLLDELFHGTNSHDRVVGAAGVLRSLLDRGAIGLVTTHDLALTAIAARLGSQAMNVHFEDRFDGGDMQFDYRMKPGPVTRSNAIALMRAVGLEVEEEEEEEEGSGVRSQESEVRKQGIDH